MHQPNDSAKRCSPANDSAKTSQDASDRPEHRRFWYSAGASSQSTTSQSTPNSDASKRPVDPNEVRR
jgi:hypothetical protein